MTVWNPIRVSAIHHRHLALGASMVDEGGWQRPSYYTGSEEELARVNASVGVCDISSVGKIIVEGANVDSPAGTPLAELPDIPSGGVVLHRFPGAGGALMSPSRVCRLSSDQIMVVTDPAAVEEVRDALVRLEEGCTHVVDMTSSLAAMAVMGPRAAQKLQKLTEQDLSPGSFPDLRCAQAAMAAVHVVVARVDAGGLPCFQILVGRDLAVHLWDAILEAGLEWDVIPFGTEALALMHAEAG